MPFSTPSLLITEILDTNLPPALAKQSTQRYGRELPMQRVETTDSPPGLCFRFTDHGLPSLDVRLTVRPLGGNVYEVQGAIEDGPTRTFSYCLPEPAPLLLPSAPRLIPEIATFFLNERERQLGRHLLKTTLRPKETSQS